MRNDPLGARLAEQFGARPQTSVRSNETVMLAFITMPGFGQTRTTDQMIDVVKFRRSSSGKSEP